jgi:hypothetical protein
MRYSKQIIKIFFILFFIGVLGFGIYRLYPILEGPYIEVYNLQNGDIKQGTFLELSGTSKNLHTLYINGSVTEFNKSGSWQSRLALYPKNNILQIVGIDKFGRETRKTFNIYSQ